MMRLQEKYKKEVLPALEKKFNFTNVLETPKITKLVINVGVGRQSKEQAFIESVEKNLMKISGQKPVKTKAKKSISSFKVREGMIIGVKVTLRGQRMYDFIEKLINVSFPRIRDFRGISDKIIDNKGNMTIGFKEHTAFPEIKVDEMDNVHGMELCISTTATNKEQGLELFKMLGFPFKKE
ncbi:MAG: 50S ribosomal protein L5 [Candidatus Falkowbacteria bacterium GW2011_GWF2_39_8]|uniref:Large ribosomal subunit protein uL5 n=1 Tax=Candidatus Falkowbacteria bacterium GW2011_GWF2_39_8 TaxID=1618642 RepID=A0A0G0SB45_9BACT|nr:MAG: 50S ribosomal protein L5 [Candidatus Falkowbacteria bacterium GW2011_GWF2_39_8]